MELGLLPEYEPEAIISKVDRLGECYFVVDRSILGRTWGGVRVAAGLGVEEVKALARSMTLKSVMAGIPIGGAKMGVNLNSNDFAKQDLLRLVSEIIDPFLRRRNYFPGTDIGFNDDDVDRVFALSKTSRTLFRGAVSVGEACATGILVCIQYLEKTRPDIRFHTVALEGFGRVGVPTARLLSQKGFRIVAVSTLDGTVCNPRGLNVDDLVQLSNIGPGKTLEAYSNSHSGATLGPKESLNFTDADILIPGARAFSIDSSVAEKVRASIVCPLSNSPITAEGEKVLARRAVTSIPDFISNSGAIIGSLAQQLSASPEETHSLISEIVTRNLELVFTRFAEGEIPKRIACQIATQRLERISSNERIESLGLLMHWIKALGIRAGLKGFTRYLSLKF